MRVVRAFMTQYLTLSGEERRQLAQLGTELTANMEELVAALVPLYEAADELHGTFTSEGLTTTLRAGLTEYLGALQRDGIDAYFDRSVARFHEGAEHGVPYEVLVVAMLLFEQAAIGIIRRLYPTEEGVAGPRSAFLKLGHVFLVHAAQAYLAGKEDTIRAQQESMLALSTPVAEVWEGVLALPLVGTIDTGRARQITQNLLRTIRDTQARIVIVDISGVPLVDTRVANHLIKTVRAANLLGARGILVGISPEIADTLISLDVGFEGIETYFSLRQGLEAALRQMGKVVVERPAPTPA